MNKENRYLIYKILNGCLQRRYVSSLICYNCILLISFQTETEIQYKTPESAKADYLSEINGKKIAFSVTRFTSYGNRNMRKEAERILQKKIKCK